MSNNRQLPNIESNDVTRRYVINRDAQATSKLDAEMEKVEKPQESLRTKMRKCYNKCTAKQVARTFLGCFPFINWLRSYKVREWLPNDLVSGITVGVVHIPQSMAFSLLAGLAPVFGLYTSFYPVLLYTLMGTSRHISIGSFAVTSLLTRTAVVRLVPDILPTVVDSAATTAIPSFTTVAAASNSSMLGLSEFDVKRASVAAAISFLVGIFQIAFGIFHLGFITSFLSSPLIKSLTTAAAIFVVTSQTPNCLGISTKSVSGAGLIVRQWIEIFKEIGNTNIATLVISIVCIILLTAGRHVNLNYKERLKVPIPTEVIVVIIAIIASGFGDFKSNFGVIVVDNVPTGFPAPVVPDLSILGDIIGDAFSIAIVALVINISLSKMYAQRFGYEVEPNQELLAYGVSNFVPSFFFCFPSAAALARCEIQVNTGGKTQMVGFITVIVILITILVLGPVFEPLPRSVLGSIIIVGLFGIIAQLGTIPELYRKSKFDFAVWLVTFLSILIFGISLGLLIGVVFAILTVIARTQRPTCEKLGNILSSDIYKSFNKYSSVTPQKGLVIFKFNSILYYANKDFFLQQLQKLTGINPDVSADNRMIATNEERLQSVTCVSATEQCESTCKEDKIEIKEKVEQDAAAAAATVKYVIIDCSAFSFIDLPAVEMLKSLWKKYNKIGVTLLLVSVCDDVREMLMRNEYYKIAGENGEFLTIHDAVVFCQSDLEKDLQPKETPTELFEVSAL